MSALFYWTGALVWCAWGLLVTGAVALHLWATWKARRAGDTVRPYSAAPGLETRREGRKSPTVEPAPAPFALTGRHSPCSRPATIQELTEAR